MKTIQITLTGQAGIGWNHATLIDDTPWPAEDPQDLGTPAQALQAAMVRIHAYGQIEKEASV